MAFPSATPLSEDINLSGLLSKMSLPDEDLSLFSFVILSEAKDLLF